MTRALLLLLWALSAAPADTLAGSVYDEATKRGISDLTLKLLPPSNVKASVLVTATDHDGSYRFGGMKSGKYLLEIAYGVTVVHREVVEVRGDMTKNVWLRSSGGDAKDPSRTPATKPAQQPTLPEREARRSPAFPSPDREMRPAPDGGMRLATAKVSVWSRDRWTETGIAVREGDVFAFTAAGEVQFARTRSAIAGPDGSRERQASGGYPVREMGAGGLVGRVGNGKPFRVGSKATIAMRDSGRLLLGINDTNFDDNDGEFRVSIRRVK